MQRLRLPRSAQVQITPRDDLFDGIVTLSADAVAVDESDWSTLYRTTPSREGKGTLTALPYYLWANRGQGSMVVWIPEA